MSVTAPAPSDSTNQLVVRLDHMLVEGHALESVVLAGHVLGCPLGTAPVVIVVGGITASPFPFGDPGGNAEPWWPALRAPDLIDPETMTVLTPCWPGNGSTWKGFDDGPISQISQISALGLADLIAAWLDGIGCTAASTFIGASLGGLVGLAFAARHPAKCGKLITISAGLRPDGWGTATRHLQRELVRDGLRTGDVVTGMVRARQLGMLTYRGRDELDTRFGMLGPELAQPPVAAYLEHHGQRFAAKFPVRTFLLLSESIDRCRFATTPAAVREVLGRVTADVLVVGVPGDLLFPYVLQHELYRELQAVGATCTLWKLDSEYGHDAFLADQDKLAALLRDARAFATTAPRPRFEGIGSRPLREIRIGMIGCGTVGGGVLSLLATQAGAMAERYGVRFRVTKIAVRDVAKLRPLAVGIAMTTKPLELIADPEVDVIVEVAGGMALEPTIRAALAAGKPVVTANKALLARKLAELGVLAQRTETPLLCEAAAAAALPIIRHLSHRADEVDSLLAIVNGTCNYIITRLEQDEWSMDRAIEEAQKLGLAEADPSADIDGHDAAAKLSILTYRAFGAWIPPDALAVRGIRQLRPADCDLAEVMGFRIRLVAQAARVAGSAELTASVEPVLLPDWHLLASVEEEYNAVYLRCAASGDLSLFGKGAGALPTATAILGDLIDLAQDNSVQWPEPRQLVPTPSTSRRHYLRVTAEAHPGLARRVDSLVRRAGLVVQNRASRGEATVTHHGFVISPSSDTAINDVVEQIKGLGRVEQTLWLGLAE